MKRPYYTIAAIGLLVVIGYFRFIRHEENPSPMLPMPADAANETAPIAALPSGSLPVIPDSRLPRISPPPDQQLVIPVASTVASSGQAQPTAIPSAMIPSPAISATPASSTAPMLPQSDGSAISNIAPAPMIAPMPAAVVAQPMAAATVPVPPAPSLAPEKNTAFPATVPGAKVLDPPAAPIPVVPLPPLSGDHAQAAAPGIVYNTRAKYVILRGHPGESSAANHLLVELMASKLLAIEGIGSLNAEEYKIRQGAIERTVAKSEVACTCETRDEVYRFMRSRVPANDASLRSVVARWCMFNGLREQALAEAREILQFQPENRNAADLVRSLEESMKQFPKDGVASSQPMSGHTATVAEAEMEITPEAATSYCNRIQPILANLCVDCHARADHAGAFKLVRVGGYEAGPQVTQVNLRATVAQLSKVEPLNSPLLIKAITAHGGLKQPPFMSRQVAGYRSLESWVVLAVGIPTSGAAASSSLPGSTPSEAVATSPVPVTAVGLPAADPLPKPPASGLPPVPSVPLTLQVAPPVVSIPPVLPMPPSLPPSTTPALPSPPMIPQVPSGRSSALPAIPHGVQPASASTSQFGSLAPPRLPNSAKSTSADEFDAAIFNRGTEK